MVNSFFFFYDDDYADNGQPWFFWLPSVGAQAFPACYLAKLLIRLHLHFHTYYCSLLIIVESDVEWMHKNESWVMNGWMVKYQLGLCASFHPLKIKFTLSYSWDEDYTSYCHSMSQGSSLGENEVRFLTSCKLLIQTKERTAMLPSMSLDANILYSMSLGVL